MTGAGTAAPSYEERVDAANQAAAKRISERADDRSKNVRLLEKGGTAAVSAIEFNYQDDLSGKELVPQVFGFDPDTFFMADEKNDFALVAVKAAPADLEQFGSNPLIEAEGKGVIGEYVTIIQHPGGLKQQVALRAHKLV